MHHTLDYIEHMSEEEICERRLMAYDFFHTYVKTGKERLNAKGFEQVDYFSSKQRLVLHLTQTVSQCISTRVTQRNKSDIRGIKTHCLLL